MKKLEKIGYIILLIVTILCIPLNLNTIYSASYKGDWTLVIVATLLIIILTYNAINITKTIKKGK